MFKGMKPLPKAIMIAAPIALTVFLYTKFGPKPVQHQVEEQQEVVQEVQPQPQTTQQVVQPTEQVVAPVETPVHQSVTSGDAGINAVLQLGKKAK